MHLLANCAGCGLNAVPAPVPDQPPKWQIRWATGAIAFVVACLISASATADENNQARVVVEANARATISVSISARVKSMPFEEGEAFKKGDTLVAFSCTRHKADLMARKSAMLGKALIVANNRRLLKHEAIGKHELAIAVAEHRQAKAVFEGQQALVSECTIKAPFDGKIVEKLINEFETPGQNQPLLKVVDTTRTRLDLIVPSKWLSWLKTGQRFQVRLDETGEVLAAKVIRLGAEVDSVSQTIRVIGAFSGRVTRVLPGMSGTATFVQPGS